MMQVIEQTREQKKKMYMKCTKSELAEMLIECNNVLAMALERNNKIIIQDAPLVWPQPVLPYYGTTCGNPPIDTVFTTTSGNCATNIN